ncbi:hypothetical protein LMG27952_05402 [Paraburkholderia hiiakae]|uniref:Uncharacterized protein n=1 Tax=Paraburkholderia hiiakae TaxID=1081782 RepID=A0ABM8P1A4_9BURK|nr:hypothetical protein LMG27952_05402 [Paraburkholderia hiiakae]
MSSSQIPEFLVQATHHAWYGQDISGNSGDLSAVAREYASASGVLS